MANGTVYLLRRGLDRGYIPVSEDSGTIRGKVDFGVSLKRRLLQQARIHVVFDEFSYDVTHNRILKSTLSRLVRTDNSDPSVRDACHDIVRRMPEVTEVELSGLIFRSIQLSRNTGVYDLLLRICELIYENLLPSEHADRRRFREFDQHPRRMWRLFQGFVLNFYKRHRPDSAPTGERGIKWDGVPENEESASVLPQMKVDISLTTHDRRVLIDTKFTPKSLQKHPRSEVKRLRSEHMYQLYAYVNNLAIEEPHRDLEGILLYPTVERELDLAFRMPNTRLRVATVDLAAEWPAIHRRLLGLID